MMKRILALVIVLVLLIPSMTFAASTQYDLISGVSCFTTSVSTWTAVTSNITKVTDGDWSSYYTLPVNTRLVCQLPSVSTVVGIKIKTGAQGNGGVLLYNSSHTQVGATKTAPAQETFVSTTSLANTAFMTYITGGSQAVDIYELEVFSQTPPATDTTPPGSVTALSATMDSSTASLYWVNPTDTDFSKSNVYLNGTLLGSTSNTGYVIKNLQPNTGYTIKVTTVDTSGNESVGITLPITTLPPPDKTPPGEVTNLTATPTTITIGLDWLNPSDADFKEVVVYLDGIERTRTNGNTVSLTGLTPDTQYNIKVTTVDQTGNESQGVSITANTLPDTPPTPPSGSDNGGLSSGSSDVPGGDQSWIAGLFIDILNWIIAAIGGVLNFILGLFPSTPFTHLIAPPNSINLGYIAWFIPVGTLVEHTMLYATAVLAYYLIRVVSRWIKLAE